MKISEVKKKKISEQILSFLFHNYPNSYYTAGIAQEIVRDEEFTKLLLLPLHSQGLIIQITKNKNGVSFIKRMKWRLSQKAIDAYKTLH